MRGIKLPGRKKNKNNYEDKDNLKKKVIYNTFCCFVLTYFKTDKNERTPTKKN